MIADLVYAPLLGLWWLSAPLRALVTRLRGRTPKARAPLGPRFGGFPSPPGSQRSIWIHAVSFGEVLAARALVRALEARWPERPLVITTTTLTGLAAARALEAAGETCLILCAGAEVGGRVRTDAHDTERGTCSTYRVKPRATRTTARTAGCSHASRERAEPAARSGGLDVVAVTRASAGVQAQSCTHARRMQVPEVQGCKRSAQRCSCGCDRS